MPKALQRIVSSCKATNVFQDRRHTEAGRLQGFGVLVVVLAAEKRYVLLFRRAQVESKVIKESRNGKGAKGGNVTRENSPNAHRKVSLHVKQK